MNVVHAAAAMLALLSLCTIGQRPVRARWASDEPNSAWSSLARFSQRWRSNSQVKPMPPRRLLRAESLVLAVWRTRADDRCQAEQRARQAALAFGAKRWTSNARAATPETRRCQSASERSRFDPAGPRLDRFTFFAGERAPCAVA